MFVLSNPQKPSEFLLQQSEGLTTAKQTQVHLICSEITPQAELALTEKNQVQGVFLKQSSDFKEPQLHCPKGTCTDVLTCTQKHCELTHWSKTIYNPSNPCSTQPWELQPSHFFLKNGLQQENCSWAHYQLLETQPSKTSKTNTPWKINAAFADWQACFGCSTAVLTADSQAPLLHRPVWQQETHRVAGTNSQITEILLSEGCHGLCAALQTGEPSLQQCAMLLFPKISVSSASWAMAVSVQGWAAELLRWTQTQMQLHTVFVVSPFIRT